MRKQELKILEVLDLMGYLNNKLISDLAKVPYGTVRCYTSLLSQSGLIQRHKELRGVFELTQKGRDCIRKRKEKQANDVKSSQT